MAIAGFVRKMSGTSEADTETMNRNVARMVEEALKYSQVESVLEDGEQEDLFSPEYFEKLSDVKIPASKLELLVKMLRKQITEYGKTNQVAAKKYQEMLEKTIAEYHERRKYLGLTQEALAEKADLTTQFVSYAESGKRAMRPENLLKIAKALNVSTDYLLTGDIIEKDYLLLSEKLQYLTPEQFRVVERVVDNCIDLVITANK